MDKAEILARADIFPGPGQLARLMRDHDWAATPLGDPLGWPNGLKVPLRMLLTSRFEMWLGWGPDLHFFYNDAYVPTLGLKHPAMLGRPFREVWAEVYEDVADQVQHVRNGEATWNKALLLLLERNGYPEETYHSFSYSPLYGESGSVEGLLCIVSEETERVISERRLELLRMLGMKLVGTLDEDTVIGAACAAINAHRHDFPFALMYLSQDGHQIRSACTEDSEHLLAYNWSLDAATFPAGGLMFELPDSLRCPTGPWNQPPVRALAVAIPGAGPQPLGFIVLGLNPYRRDDVGVMDIARLVAGQIGGALVNVTALKAEQERSRKLAESEERLQLALSCGRGIGIWDWDVSADRVVADERFARLYGVDPGKANVGAPIAEFFTAMHADDVEPVRRSIAAAVKTGELFSEEYRLIQPDGDVRWVVAEGRCSLTPAGTPSRFIGVTFDITDRKQIEERLRVLNADLEQQVIERSSERGTTWQVSPLLFSVIDLADGRFLRVNPAWTATLGWADDEITGARYVDFLHPDDVTASAGAFEQVRRGLPLRHFENRYRAKDGSYHWLAWVAVPEDGKLYSTTRDITQEKEQAETLARTEDALRQSQKMEAVGQLTGGLAHDFNNILAGLSGSMEMLQARISQGRFDAVDRYLAAGAGAIKRASALTHRLLAFSRRQTLDPKSVNLNRLVSDMEDLIRRTVGPSVRVEVVGAGALWQTFVDPNQLDNALLNLCINARDAMPDGGSLTIETANRWLDERAAAEAELPVGQYVSLCVTDNGAGMTPDVIAKAFDPFFTTKPTGQGTGLGLSMIYGFARQSGGHVRIYSEVGVGTTACIYLPRHDGDAEPDALGATVEEALPSQGGKIVLVIDDEPVIRMLIADVLADLGYVGVEASDGPSGLRLLQSVGHVDLLITDVGLPGGLNGRQVADAARVARPDLKVLFITGYAENAAIGHGHLDRGMQVTTKPFGMGELARKIRLMME